MLIGALALATLSCAATVSPAGSSARPEDKSKIDHFVVLFMENRAFDHLLGCLDHSDIDGIPASGRLLPIDPDNSSKGHVNVTCGSADYICPGAPSYSFYDQKFPLTGKAPPVNYSAPVKCAAFAPGGACRPNTQYTNLGNDTTAAACQALCEAQQVDGCCWHTDRNIEDNCQWVAGGTPFYAGDPAVRSSARCARGGPPVPVDVSSFPYPEQSDAYSYQHGAHGDAIDMFSASQLPVKAAIAREFGVFNKLFSAVPSASNPNHMFAQSGTSCGLMNNNGNYKTCGGGSNATTFPQRTIYDNLRENNRSFALYTNASGVFNDLIMDGVARHKDRFHNYSHFFAAAASGSLPNFSFVTPPSGWSDHPCQDIRHGERLVKDLYEALRAGPGWDRTLFAVVYDDIGGFYDHVIPPADGVPADDAPCHVSHGCPDNFDFRRLGGRVAAYLMSPYVAKGTVFQEPRGPTNTSQFDLSSISSTVKTLFSLPDFLTKRDAWAGSFEELLLDTPRDDTPLHLPLAPGQQSPHSISCGQFHPGWACRPRTYVTLASNSTARGCAESCEVQRKDGCCWYGPEDKECEWVAGGEAYAFGGPTKRSATQCAGHVVPAVGHRRQLGGTDLDTEPIERHCGATSHVCTDATQISDKQRRKIAELAMITGAAMPEGVDKMDSARAEQWIEARYTEFIAL